MNKKIAVFPGSFDPITLGHVALVKKALPLFDEIVVSIGENSGKQYYFSLEERMAHLKAVFAKFQNVKIERYHGLTVDFCQQNSANFILRGLRDVKDFEFEKSIAQMNTQLNSEVETLFLMTDAEFAPINSYIVRDILKNGGDASPFLPKEIVELIHKR